MGDSTCCRRPPRRFLVWRLIPLVLLCLLTVASTYARDSGAKATYVGGSLPGLPDSAKGRIDSAHRSAFRFIGNRMEAQIPWDKINMLEYGQRASRRIGLAILVSPLFLMTKSRKHFLTISYLDEKERQQALVFEVDKEHVRNVLVTMEARTGLRVEFQDNEARFGGESQ